MRVRPAYLIDSDVLIWCLPACWRGRSDTGILMRNRGPGYVDCHIAATALLRKVPLVTYNRKDYGRTGARLFDTSEWDPEAKESPPWDGQDA